MTPLWDAMITEPALLLFFAKRNSGKTTAIKDILIRNRLRGNFTSVIAVCPTDFEKSYVTSSAADIVLSEYREIIIERLLDNCKRYIQTHGKKPKIALVLDDCLEEVNWTSDKVIQSIATTGRHYGITLFIATQKPTSLPPIFRRNADYAIIFRQVSYDNIDMLTKEYSACTNKADFHQMITGPLTDSYGMIVVDDKDQQGRYKQFRSNLAQSMRAIAAAKLRDQHSRQRVDPRPSQKATCKDHKPCVPHKTKQ